MDAARLIRIDDPGDPRIAEFVSMRERDLAGRGEQFIAEGTVVLQALLDARERGHFDIVKLLLLENRVGGLADLIARLDPAVPVHVAAAPVLDAVVGFAMHRGVLALGVRRPPADLASFLAGLPDQALVVACCGISNHDNMGSIFRNAGVFGADGVALDATSCSPLYRKAIRVSVGAALHVPFCRSGSVEAMASAIVGSGFDLIGLSPRGTVALEDYRPPGRVALLLGTEGAGLPQAVLDRVTSVRIAQAPGLDSLNVATATGIALWRVAGAMGRLP
ncbi:tRNA G18 (ribose-2'-O)-methylase SpoU [Hoeflea marina]|uniref:tRNA G18 (Ribose-2'-O)-methylase SpoU n=1 Tax=Hoeflea marina TaxID=274592 RepID=A0A317PER5_9HYPH|nr:RNA methyltransferase [Hoeflea marina]PWV95823.1 tRNA G18 (ribose-2'-O)-methylase SpoU [Hoeflea marina]